MFKKNIVVWKQFDIYISYSEYPICLRRTLLYGNIIKLYGQNLKSFKKNIVVWKRRYQYKHQNLLRLRRTLLYGNIK